MQELAEHIVDLTRSSSEIYYTDARPGDPERRRPIIDKVQGRYEWEPRVHLREGLRLTIEAFRKAEAAVSAPATVPEPRRTSIPVNAAVAPA